MPGLCGLWPRLMRRSAAERLLLGHAIALHATIALACRIVPLGRIDRALARLYRQRRGSTRAESQILWAAATAAHLSPGSGTCLSHALTAQALLRRHGGSASLRIGVRPHPRDRFASHAWLERAGAVLVGGEVDCYHPIWGN